MNISRTNITSYCKLIEIFKHNHKSGNISVIENHVEIPFSVNRIYYLYDIPSGESRGGHAHKSLFQLIIAASGSFNVIIDDGVSKQTYFLNRPNCALLIVPGIWRELNDFSSGSVCLVLASELYTESDYIRDYDDFINYKKI